METKKELTGKEFIELCKVHKCSIEVQEYAEYGFTVHFDNGTKVKVGVGEVFCMPSMYFELIEP